MAVAETPHRGRRVAVRPRAVEARVEGEMVRPLAGSAPDAAPWKVVASRLVWGAVAIGMAAGVATASASVAPAAEAEVARVATVLGVH